MRQPSITWGSPASSPAQRRSVGSSFEEGGAKAPYPAPPATTRQTINGDAHPPSYTAATMRQGITGDVSSRPSSGRLAPPPAPRPTTNDKREDYQAFEPARAMVNGELAGGGGSGGGMEGRAARVQPPDSVEVLQVLDLFNSQADVIRGYVSRSVEREDRLARCMDRVKELEHKVKMGEDRVEELEEEVKLGRDRVKGLEGEVKKGKDLAKAALLGPSSSLRATSSLAECVGEVVAELGASRAENERLARDNADLSSEIADLHAELEVGLEERDEARRQLALLRAYALNVEAQLREPPRPAYSAGVYVTYDTMLQQQQYRPNVTALVGLLDDPRVEVKGEVWDPSELLQASSSSSRAGGDGSVKKVLLYVTYCPNPRLCVSSERLKSFTNLPDITVVFIILKRGVNSQLTDVRSARELVPWLPRLVLHYGIEGTGLEGADTPAGEMNVRSSKDLGALIRSVFPPPTPPRRQPTVARPDFLPPLPPLQSSPSPPIIPSSGGGGGGRGSVSAPVGRSSSLSSAEPCTTPLDTASSSKAFHLTTRFWK